MNLEKICQEVGAIAKQTGHFIKSEGQASPSHSFHSKGLHDFVTDVDRKSEVLILDSLEKILPEAGFIAEENTRTDLAPDYNWIVDPLDGTTNFIHRLFPYSVSIALSKKQEVILGVVYEIGADELYYAWNGGGTWCNGNRIGVSGTEELDRSLIATGFPFTNFDRLEPYMKVLKNLMKRTRGLRRFGSAAVDLAYLAAGKFDGFFEYNLNPWDVAAGIILVKEAGGSVTDFKGGSDYLFGREIVASNNRVHQEFLELIRQDLSIT